MRAGERQPVPYVTRSRCQCGADSLAFQGWPDCASHYAAASTQYDSPTASRGFAGAAARARAVLIGGTWGCGAAYDSSARSASRRRRARRRGDGRRRERQRGARHRAGAPGRPPLPAAAQRSRARGRGRAGHGGGPVSPSRSARATSRRSMRAPRRAASAPEADGETYALFDDAAIQELKVPSSRSSRTCTAPLRECPAYCSTDTPADGVLGPVLDADAATGSDAPVAKYRRQTLPSSAPGEVHAARRSRPTAAAASRCSHARSARCARRRSRSATSSSRRRRTTSRSGRSTRRRAALPVEEAQHRSPTRRGRASRSRCTATTATATARMTRSCSRSTSRRPTCRSRRLRVRHGRRPRASSRPPRSPTRRLRRSPRSRRSRARPLSNAELMRAIDPRGSTLPYVYDTFKWEHCLGEGYDFDDLGRR